MCGLFSHGWSWAHHCLCVCVCACVLVWCVCVCLYIHMYDIMCLFVNVFHNTIQLSQHIRHRGPRQKLGKATYCAKLNLRAPLGRTAHASRVTLYYEPSCGNNGSVMFTQQSHGHLQPGCSVRHALPARWVTQRTQSILHLTLEEVRLSLLQRC